ncbi:MAG: hypothetical protein FJX22_01450 [Alphaproteobacteria bacterium]|nr:hypothetical protein [Alphaproteobacteria bacterium]
MNDVFDWAIEVVLNHEGYDQKICQKNGLETRFGLSRHQYPSLNLAQLSREQAVEIYRRDWWHAYGYGQIKDIMLATKLLDLSVQLGAGTAHRIVQRALRAAGFCVVEDGVLGAKTLKAVNQTMPSSLLAALRAEAAGYCRWLAQRRPELEHQLESWLKRAYA